MKVLWVNPSFLDYRVAVYKELSDLVDGELTLIYSKERVPERVIGKIEAALGTHAIGLTGERKFDFGGRQQQWANSFIRIPYQPGLLSMVMKTPADVVIGEGFFQWTPTALVKRVIQKTPLVISYERTHHTERQCPHWRRSYRRWVMRYVDSVLCSGTQCVEYTKSLGMPADRMTTGHMAADVDGLQKMVDAISAEERWDIRQRLNIKGIYFLYVGQLIARKGVDKLLQGWNLFEKAHPNAGTLVIAGGGELQDELEKFMTDHNLKNIRFLGHIDYDQIATYYATADVFTFPTREDNWALVIPEAMACGLPVICSKYCGCATDIVRENNNGWIFDPDSPEQILQNLWRCVEQKDQLPHMGESSRKIVKNHTPRAAAQSILDGCQIAITHRHGHKFKA